MYRLALVLSIGIIAACTSTVEPPPVAVDPVEATITPLIEPEPVPVATLPEYDATWYISSGWPGEYPPGFSILEPGIVLTGRAQMHPLAEANLACPVEEFATYQPWNFVRAEADALDFRVATRLFEITMTTDAPIEVPADDMGYVLKLLPLKAGDVLTYKRYLGEGYAIIAHDGVDYEINEAELANVSDINRAVEAVDGGEDLWVEVKCHDAAASRAWVLYDEAIVTAGVGPTPITGYGMSVDLTPKDVDGVRLQMQLDADSEIQN